MATIRQVAEIAGVSVGTVSNVLNGLGTVTDNNRIKVLKAVEVLDFKPNKAARMLKTSRSESITLILPSITSLFYPELARGVEDVAREKGFSVILCNSDRSRHEEDRYIDFHIQSNIDGLIVVKPHMDKERVEALQSTTSVVLIDADEKQMQDINLVNSDSYFGQMEAVRYLYRLGHREIGYIGGQLDAKSDFDRLNAFRDAHEIYEIPLNENNIKCGVYSFDHGYLSALTILNRPDRPTAILCANDIIAFGALRSARELGLHVPDDVSIMGFDNIEASVYCEPQLTTVNHPKYELGRVSALMLIAKIQNEAEPSKHLQLRTSVVVRESTAPPRKKAKE